MSDLFVSCDRCMREGCGGGGGSGAIEAAGRTGVWKLG
jgi:hypothetical protein